MIILGTVAGISSGWKWLAVLIAFGVLALIWIFIGVTNKKIGWNIWKLVEGADGTASTSKFQWFIWLVVVFFAYVVLWVIRAKGGDYSAISRVPANVLAVLGFSTATMAAAKGITAGYVGSGRLTTKSSLPSKTQMAPAAGSPAIQGGILRDDSGYPELAKIQMMGFTFIAVGIFVATLIHQIVNNPVNTQLPDIDSSLLVLMGLSQGGYLGKKLVSFGSPVLYPLSSPMAAPGGLVTVQGAGLGAIRGGSQLTIDAIPIAHTSWTDSAISFQVPNSYPVGNVPWRPNQLVQIGVIVGGQSSNEVPLTVT